MSQPRVLIADDLSPAAVDIFRSRGIDVDVRTGLSKADLETHIGEFDGLAVRSATKVTEKVVEAGRRLRVIGRAGIGVDTIDLKAATRRGIVVMNTPFGNSITTAEHAISLMLALARQIPAADQSTRAGKWEKSRFVGVEISGKTLGVIGCGNIGRIVSDRAQGLKMKVLAYDPFLSEDRAVEIGVEKVELRALLERSDFVTLHTPLTAKTRNLIDGMAIAMMKPGVRIINCARGGLIDEVALQTALLSGHVAGAALDVFAEEPATDHPLFALPNVICTPHLGASTREAQENVALQIADQMSDYLLDGAVTNAVNFPSVTAAEAPRLKPYVTLASQLGSFAGQLTDRPIKEVRIEYVGAVAAMKIKVLTAALLAGLLAPALADGVNMVSAPGLAQSRGITVEEALRDQDGALDNYVRLTVVSDEFERSVAGAVLSDGRPRLIQIRGINMDVELTPHMLFVRNADQPGFIGTFGTLMGRAGVNIATFALGRDRPGGDAICLAAVDTRVSDDLLREVAALPHVVRVNRLEF